MQVQERDKDKINDKTLRQKSCLVCQQCRPFDIAADRSAGSVHLKLETYFGGMRESLPMGKADFEP